MSLALDLIDGALAADLSQNELKVFLVLFRQTIGFGRPCDPLTPGRIGYIAHIRSDRVPVALQAVLATGLFYTQPHAEHDLLYRINDELIAANHGVYAPYLRPQYRQASSKKQNSTPEKRVHTVTENTFIHLPTTTAQPEPEPPPPKPEAQAESTAEPPPPKRELEQSALPYPPSFTPEQRKTAANWLDGLKPEDARDCLRVLQQAIQRGKVRSPLGYLHHLIQLARQQKLNRSALTPPQPPTPAPAPAPTAIDPTIALRKQLQSLAQDIQQLDSLYRLANEPMDAVTAQKRAAWVADYQRLKQQLAAV